MAVQGRAAARAAALGLLALLPSGAARASGVDGAGKTVVVPLAFTGSPRESIFTLTNPNPEPARVKASYVGAEGTLNAASVRGTLGCEEQIVPVHGSLTILLRHLCPEAFTPDGENLGYVILDSSADARPNIFVSTTVSSNGVSTGIDGQPIGDHDPGFPPQASLGLEVGGLRTRLNQQERPRCFVGTFGDPKKVSFALLDGTGTVLGAGLTRMLDPMRMEVLDLESEFGLGPMDLDDLRLIASSSDPGFLLLGCGGENKTTKSVAYQASQTPEPADRSRLHSVVVHAQTNPGPYQVPYIWSHSLLTPGSADLKVVLSTYVRPDDELRCWLEAWSMASPAYDTSPYLELQVLDSRFSVIAGGSGVKDTGTFRTRSRGGLPSAAGDRYLIEVSYDEAASWPHWPSYVPPTGGWQVHCTSAAGMSEPIPVPMAAPDNF